MQDIYKWSLKNWCLFKIKRFYTLSKSKIDLRSEEAVSLLQLNDKSKELASQQKLDGTKKDQWYNHP